MTTIKWTTVNEIDYSDVIQLFNEYDFETIHEWREGEFRGETEYQICSYTNGNILIVRESHYKIKDIKI